MDRKMSGLLSDVLPFLYSQGDRAKRYAKGLLSDPGGTLARSAGQLSDSARENLGLLNRAIDDKGRMNDEAATQFATQALTGLLGMAPVGMTKAAFPQAEALERARKNAVEMLGLPQNNTPMDRARALGFTDNAYHGTADDVARLDRSKYGSSTGANSAKRAFWATDDAVTARGYAEHAATDSKVKRLVEEAERYEKRGNWNAYDESLRKAEELEASFRTNSLLGQNIMPLLLRGQKAKVVDAKGAEFVDVEGGVNKMLQQAMRDRADMLTIKNLADDVGFNNRPATHYGVLNPAVVRSRFAAFDPARVNENDLLGFATPEMRAWLALGSTGAAALMNRDK